ncbi:glycoside hydrolase [Thermoanaerobacter sp. YS13]|uniref:glycosyl hydrolase family 18 protein n=1 Tax=Thermoanaerobacter sp. YS13 TaxID=1511746 RepID=UPI00057322F5|nr:glycosyl hydrolase family 18 protein [Thermoanaerobacter sp. YS13]KHO62887.1 glycoside hydrolase [Thermoanaerobacter sp. YS13]
MRKKLRFVLILIVLLFTISIFLSACKNTIQKPFFKPFGKLGLKKLHVVGFYVDSAGPDNSYQSLVKYSRYIDTLSPLWLTVEGDGTVKDSTNPQALDYAKKQGIKIVPLVNVANSKDEVLLDPNIREKAISQLMALLKKHNFDGYNIDFEFIPHGTKNYIKDKDYLTAFVSKIRPLIKKEGKILDISVIPHYHVPKEISGIYDYHKLAPLVDHVTLMTYDRHNASTPPGPVSPEQWVEYNVKDALNEGFKPQQICLGVATYGYDWPVSKSGGFSRPTKEILTKAQIQGIQIKWSNQYQEPYYVYYDKNMGITREVWFENSATLAEKIEVAKRYNLHGICVWRIGFETPSFWNVIGKKIGSR